MKVFLDTNVVLDFLGERELFFDEAQFIVNLADEETITIYVSALTYATCNYFLSKKFGFLIAKDKLVKFKILSKIVALDDIVVEKSLTSNFNDFEDGLQYFSALKVKCEYIITRNVKDFKASDILSLTPTEFIISYNKKLS